MAIELEREHFVRFTTSLTFSLKFDYYTTGSLRMVQVISAHGEFGYDIG